MMTRVWLTVTDPRTAVSRVRDYRTMAAAIDAALAAEADGYFTRLCNDAGRELRDTRCPAWVAALDPA